MSSVALLGRRVAALESAAEICRRLAGFVDGGPDRERVYRFVESETGCFSVAALCRATRVSRSSYYEWRRRCEGPSGTDSRESAGGSGLLRGEAPRLDPSNQLSQDVEIRSPRRIRTGS